MRNRDSWKINRNPSRPRIPLKPMFRLQQEVAQAISTVQRFSRNGERDYADSRKDAAGFRFFRLTVHYISWIRLFNYHYSCTSLSICRFFFWITVWLSIHSYIIIWCFIEHFFFFLESIEIFFLLSLIYNSFTFGLIWRCNVLARVCGSSAYCFRPEEACYLSLQ